MPFRSRAQQRFMFARHPAIAKRWAKEYGVPSGLPEHSAGKRAKGKSRRDIRREQMIDRFRRKAHG